MNESPVQALLDDVTNALEKLREHNLKNSAQLAPNFCIFDYLRKDELGLSRCFADLLNPNGKHGQGRLYLDGFLALIDWQEPNSDCKVQLEKQAIEQDRIDIYLQFSPGAIGIENKPWAFDGPNQLKKYAEYLNKTTTTGVWKLIYLCNHKPSIESISIEERTQLETSKNYLQLTYVEIAEWLENAAAQTKALVVRVYVEELVRFIRKHINREMDMSESVKTVETMLSENRFLSAAFDVSNALPTLKKQMMLRLKTQLETGVQNLEGIFIDTTADWNTEKTAWWNVSDVNKWTGFTLWLDTARFGHVALRFSFEREDYDGFFWGITSFAPKRPNSNAGNCAIIFKLFEPHLDLKKQNQTDHWAFWAYPNTKVTPDWPKHWAKQVRPWQSIQDNTLAGEVFAVAKKVRQILDQAPQ